MPWNKNIIINLEFLSFMFIDRNDCTIHHNVHVYMYNVLIKIVEML